MSYENQATNLKQYELETVKFAPQSHFETSQKDPRNIDRRPPAVLGQTKIYLWKIKPVNLKTDSVKHSFKSIRFFAYSHKFKVFFTNDYLDNKINIIRASNCSLVQTIRASEPAREGQPDDDSEEEGSQQNSQKYAPRARDKGRKGAIKIVQKNKEKSEATIVQLKYSEFEERVKRAKQDCGCVHGRQHKDARGY